ncbi:MAG: hypothetical protein JSR18_15350 [Proteobacteria bacterium]|nr:hypothetical protein [Pseudomonadota bacterium]
MKFGKHGLQAAAGLMVVALASGVASAQVTTRLVTAGGSATTAKILPGGSTSMDVRLDTTVGTVGFGLRLNQTAPGTSGYVSITARSFSGSPYSDSTFGIPDGTALAPADALLDPDNTWNLGQTTPSFTPTAAASNILAVNLTLTASAGTPLGTYKISPLSPNSTVTDASLVDYPMGGEFDLVVGQTLTVTKSGTGTGTVSDGGTINCGATCSDIFPGTAVTLTATPDVGSTFVGWSGGGCSGTGSCVVTVDAAKTVNAQFDLSVGPTYLLTVTKSGNGSGTVTSSPSGINCGATCSFSYASSTVVTLTAAADAGKNFTGWSGGGCSGTSTCVVTMNAATSVQATFTDTIAPTVSFTSTPPNPTTSTSASFSFTANEAGSTFECSLDGAPFASCTSPHGVSALSVAPHSFAVRATDPAGNTSSPITYDWTVEAVVPPPASTAVPVPALNDWVLAVLGLMLAASAGLMLRRRMH